MRTGAAASGALSRYGLALTDTGQVVMVLPVKPEFIPSKVKSGDYVNILFAAGDNSLSRLPRLRVLARTTAFRYKGKDFDPTAIGQQLNVRTILTERGATLTTRMPRAFAGKRSCRARRGFSVCMATPGNGPPMGAACPGRGPPSPGTSTSVA